MQSCTCNFLPPVTINPLPSVWNDLSVQCYGWKVVLGAEASHDLCPSTMGEEMLTWLVLLHVNKFTEVDPDPDDTIELYVSKKERRIRLLGFCECVICEYIKCWRISCHSLACSTFISTLNQPHSRLLFIITSSRNVSLFRFFISFEIQRFAAQNALKTHLLQLRNLTIFRG